jgi:hypothetical protein
MYIFNFTWSLMVSLIVLPNVNVMNLRLRDLHEGLLRMDVLCTLYSKFYFENILTRRLQFPARKCLESFALLSRNFGQLATLKGKSL